MPEEMVYASQQVSLRPCTFELPGYTFDGWNGMGFGSFYPYGTHVTNLCGLDEDRTVINKDVYLYAVLAQVDTAHHWIADNGEGIDLEPGLIKLSKDSVDYTPFKRSGTAGLYIIEPPSAGAKLDAGTYAISIEDYDTRDTTMKIAEDGSGSACLEYFTVSVKTDGQTSAWIGEEGQTSVEKCMAGDDLKIEASAKAEGYSFKT